MSDELIRIGVLSAVSVWGIMEAIKPSIKRWAKDSWARSGIRVACLAMGAGWGLLLRMDATGAVVGVCGAALSSIIVGIVKAKANGRSKLV